MYACMQLKYGLCRLHAKEGASSALFAVLSIMQLHAALKVRFLLIMKYDDIILTRDMFIN